ncbi:uncharacterized protein TRIADDRAFT_19546 [Trichoplax adhaerens]|uniref:Tyrosyl-DNA phosphodiesterase 1 n=1 Tax=Trichoplax adhaerens TaxID=10228 RepID=B3RKM1_TRIAD|nr:hypothetical protein TRIADDRAFT_19546 [Trichoplax adhaerens]EDV29188.1 hypothetical protein TRIADDRAFT_19546 [Trichoplax adhaerens]|eukprot:XP_002108390.1 hypothetical protein TRIADDRAFT_19546 [Trichoplax adhaerens]
MLQGKSLTLYGIPTFRFENPRNINYRAIVLILVDIFVLLWIFNHLILEVYLLYIVFKSLINILLVGEANSREVTESPRKKLKSHDVRVEQPRVETKEHSQDQAEPDQMCNKYSYYLSKVRGLNNNYNSRTSSIHIREILALEKSELISSIQFNYMFDVSWLLDQYPEDYRKNPVLIVHGYSGQSRNNLEQQGQPFPNVKFHQAKLEMAYGTHHSKMMFLLYSNGLRIVIHTANLIPQDWGRRTQGIWISPLFLKRSDKSEMNIADDTGFKQDLLDYVASYGPALFEWRSRIMEHDMSSVNVFLIASVPGRHAGKNIDKWGHLKLRKILKRNGPSKDDVSANWPAICQFSSIGSLGSKRDAWLYSEFRTSLSSTSTTRLSQLGERKADVKLIFPSVENVRNCLEGYKGGSCLPYNRGTANKQPWLNSLLHNWAAKKTGRHRASPHIKTYTRVSPDNTELAWFLITRQVANLSKAAWGTMEKNETQLMIRSYEIGVLFLPKQFGDGKTFKTCDLKTNWLIPYDLPLIPYGLQDSPWTWDTPHLEPDTHGAQWIPGGYKAFRESRYDKEEQP